MKCDSGPLHTHPHTAHTAPIGSRANVRPSQSHPNFNLRISISSLISATLAFIVCHTRTIRVNTIEHYLIPIKRWLKLVGNLIHCSDFVTDWKQIVLVHVIQFNSTKHWKPSQESKPAASALFLFSVYGAVVGGLVACEATQISSSAAAESGE